MKGFIRERTPGRYTAYWKVAEASTGQYRQHTKAGFTTKREARRYLNSIIGSVQDGSWKPDQALTVAQLLRDHWLPAQRPRVRPTTFDQYKGAVETWVLPYLGAVKVATLTPKLVTEWQDTLSTERQLSARSLQMSTGFLKAATKYALENGLVSRDPLVAVRRPRSQSRAMKVWTPEQARVFLAGVKEDRLYAAFAILLGRGLRRGEVAGLRWEYIDLDAGTLRVATTRVLTNGGQAVESGPKTDAGARTIDLDASLVAILRQHRRRQLEEHLRAGEAWQDTGYVFVSELGEPYYPGYFSDAWERRISTLGLPKIRLHDARHTCFTAMLAAGEPVKVVQELAGHANPNITLAVYAHVLPGMAKAAGERLSAQLFS
ncbi:MAG: tyrosine-type recombinase/integrase [Actinomycetota bacterium]|nr:tyrosine-type recombinase/integrase [Actinomycetota bacterium]